MPAILASAAMPLVFTPTAIGGRLYSDGGITNNFPVEPLLGHCDVLLGIYASPLEDRAPSDLRSSLAVSHRAFEIGMYYSSRRKFHHCDLVISPRELGRFGVFDVGKMEEILEIGYRATRKRVDAIAALVAERGG